MQDLVHCSIFPAVLFEPPHHEKIKCLHCFCSLWAFPLASLYTPAPKGLAWPAQMTGALVQAQTPNPVFQLGDQL